MVVEISVISLIILNMDDHSKDIGILYPFTLDLYSPVLRILEIEQSGTFARTSKSLEKQIPRLA